MEVAEDKQECVKGMRECEDTQVERTVDKQAAASVLPSMRFVDGGSPSCTCGASKGERSVLRAGDSYITVSMFYTGRLCSTATDCSCCGCP